MFRLKIRKRGGGGKGGESVFVNVRHFGQILKYRYNKTVLTLVFVLFFLVCLFCFILLFSRLIQDGIYNVSDFEMTTRSFQFPYCWGVDVLTSKDRHLPLTHSLPVMLPSAFAFLFLISDATSLATLSSSPLLYQRTWDISILSIAHVSMRQDWLLSMLWTHSYTEEPSL